jgi:hypothetical protein
VVVEGRSVSVLVQTLFQDMEGKIALKLLFKQKVVK